MVVPRLYPPSVSQLVDHRQTDVFNKFCKLVCSLLLMKQYPTLPFGMDQSISDKLMDPIAVLVSLVNTRKCNPCLRIKSA